MEQGHVMRDDLSAGILVHASNSQDADLAGKLALYPVLDF
jgi:hypothetical protein